MDLGIKYKIQEAKIKIYKNLSKVFNFWRYAGAHPGPHLGRVLDSM